MISVNPAPAAAKDIEVIVTLMEIAAISLTTHQGAVLSADAIFAEAQDVAGADLTLERRDFDLVLARAGFFLKRVRGGYCLK